MKVVIELQGHSESVLIPLVWFLYDEVGLHSLDVVIFTHRIHQGAFPEPSVHGSIYTLTLYVRRRKRCLLRERITSA